MIHIQCYFILNIRFFLGIFILVIIYVNFNTLFLKIYFLHTRPKFFYDLNMKQIIKKRS